MHGGQHLFDKQPLKYELALRPEWERPVTKPPCEACRSPMPQLNLAARRGV